MKYKSIFDTNTTETHNKMRYRKVKEVLQQGRQPSAAVLAVLADKEMEEDAKRRIAVMLEEERKPSAAVLADKEMEEDAKRRIAVTLEEERKPRNVLTYNEIEEDVRRRLAVILEKARELSEPDPDPASTPEEKAIYDACCNGDYNYVKQYIEAKKDIDITVYINGEYEFLLDTAIINGHTDIALLLIENGATIDFTNKRNGANPLIAAVKTNQKEIIRSILESDNFMLNQPSNYDFDVNEKRRKYIYEDVDYSNHNAFYYALYNKDLESFIMLTNKYTDGMNDDFEEILRESVCMGCLPITKYIIENCLEPADTWPDDWTSWTYQDESGSIELTLLDIALEHHDIDCAKYLLSSGYNNDKEWKEWALNKAYLDNKNILTNKDWKMEDIQFLVETIELDVDQIDEEGYLPITKYENFETRLYLAEHGADPNEEDEHGNTGLSICKDKGEQQKLKNAYKQYLGEQQKLKNAYKQYLSKTPKKEYKKEYNEYNEYNEYKIPYEEFRI